MRNCPQYAIKVSTTVGRESADQLKDAVTQSMFLRFAGISVFSPVLLNAPNDVLFNSFNVCSNSK